MTCREVDLEALVLGELAPPHALRARRHVAECSACADEHAWLVRERRALGALLDTDEPLPDVHVVLARALPTAPAPTWAWAKGILALGLAPAAALSAIFSVGAPLPATTVLEDEAALRDAAPVCYLGGDAPEGGVARMEAMYAACLVASPRGVARDDRDVTDPVFSSHGREACE